MGQYDITDFGDFEPKPTDKQMDLVRKLCAELGMSVPKLKTLKEASRWLGKYIDIARDERRLDEEGLDWDARDWGDL